ncbi:MAG: hypothetical protein IJN12_01035 [Clostridia bacterium]|nr:hypothetical protein [Clostridia bacterium]
MMLSFPKMAKDNIDLAIETINKISDNQKFDPLRSEINRNVINAIGAIANCYARMDFSLLLEDDDKYMRAFAYLNNQIKHDTTLEIIYFDVSGSIYPFRYPMRFGKPGIFWSDFKDNGRTNARGKRIHYDEILKNKDVEVTLIQAKDIISNYFGDD